MTDHSAGNGKKGLFPWQLRESSDNASSGGSGVNPLSGRQLLALLTLILLLAAFLNVLLSSHRDFSIPSYRLGDIARTDILIPRDTVIEDEDATHLRREEVRAEAFPVYRFNPTIQEDQLSSIKAAFARSRQALGLDPDGKETLKRKRKATFRTLPAAARDKLVSTLQTLGVKQPVDELLDFLVREGFNASLEARLTDLAQTAFSALIVPDDSRPDRRKQALHKLNLQTGKEEAVSLDQVFTISRARDRINGQIAQARNLPANWKPHLSRILEGLTQPNLVFDERLTEARQEQDAANVDLVLRKLKKGKVVLRQGDEVEPDHLVQMEAIRRLSPVKVSASQAIGTGVLIALLLAIFLLFLRFAPQGQWHYLRLAGFSLFTLSLNLLLLKVSWFICESLSQNVLMAPLNDKSFFFYALPFAQGSMLITLLAGEQSALLFTIFFGLLAGHAVGADAYGFFYILVANLAGILMIRKATQRIGMVVAGFKLGLISVFLFFLLQIAKQAPLEPLSAGFGAALALLSGLLNALFLLFTLPLCERLFMATTEIRLSELGDMNLPLIREMILKAPGTYNHSIAVGTLCEGAAKTIGLNPLFLRIASLYHDIGKTGRPDHFIENQHGINPHDELLPPESAAILKGHVLEGVRMAQKANLPPSLVDMIPQHHGTKLIHFFFEKAKRQAKPDDGEIREETYRYPGPKPRTKAASILILADQIEAAARSLDSHAPAKLNDLIRKITCDAITDGQFTESDLTLAEMDRIGASFLQTLSSYYHGRIVYPGFNLNGDAPAKNGAPPPNQR